VTTSLPSPTDLHDDQVVALLRSGAHASLLIAYFGETEYRELSQLAKLAATRRNPRGRRAFILPGIMGSRLGRMQRGAAHLLWLHPTALGGGGLKELALPGSRTIRAVGVMLPGYLKLKLSLEVAGFRPMFYPFYWRLDVDQLARAFMRAVESASKSRVLVVGHSMGGLVARAALAYDNKRRIEMLVQIGSPNAGSFAPVQALRAAYPTVRKIAALDHTCSAETLAQRVFHTLPGLYQMLPTADAHARVDLLNADHWPDDGLKPDGKLLARAHRLRARLPDADERCRVIIGTHQETIVSVTRQQDGFEYEIRRAGDGTVPTSRALWPGAPTWYVAENHGALTQNDAVLGAVDDILTTGDTARLTSRAPALATEVVRRVTDAQLRSRATTKVRWEALSLDSRRRILEPVITAEFEAPTI
jgi:pimeloyl-ACP methyl ester carboxylesterase